MIKDVEATDLPAIAAMLKGLGYNTSQQALEQKYTEMSSDDEYKVLIDVEDDKIVGLIALHTISVFHRASKVGRITSFVVDESYRGNRASKMLLDAGDEYFRHSGCNACEAAGGMVNSHLRKQFLDRGYKALDQHLTKTLRP